MNLQYKKAVALGTILLFLSSNLCLRPSFAAQPPESIPSAGFLKDTASIQVPANLGKVQEFFQGSGKTVILIQDAHAIPDAQRNIQKIIDHFQKQYGVRLVALEGAASKADPQIFRSFPDRELLKKTFEEYFEKGELAGANAAAIFNESPTIYHGVENWKLYEEGLGLYLAAMEKEPGLLEKLSSLEKGLQTQKEKIYSKDLLEIDRLLAGFRQNHSDLVSVLKALSHVQKPAKGSELDLILRETERSGTDQSAVEMAVKALAVKVQAYLKNLPPSPEQKTLLREFSEKFQEFQTSRTTPQAFALFLKELIAEKSLPIQFPENLTQLTGEQKKMKDIEGTQFFKDFEVYSDSVKEKLFRNEEERNLDREGREFEVLGSLIRLELSREDWEKFREILNRGNAFIPAEKLQFQISFYENAQKRDAAFLENLMKLMKDKPSSILVAGGFHSQGLAERLRSKGISYVLVMPQIKSIPEETHYRDHMRGNVSWKNYFEVEQGRINLYKAFVRATRDKLLNAAKDESGRILKNWRDQIIRDLAEKGQIEKAGNYTGFMDETVKKESNAKLQQGMERVEIFLTGLRDLESKGQLTEANILKLLSPATAADVATYDVLGFEDRSDPRLLREGLAISIRSETRSAVSQAEALAKDAREKVAELSDLIRLLSDKKGFLTKPFWSEGSSSLKDRLWAFLREKTDRFRILLAEIEKIQRDSAILFGKAIQDENLKDLEKGNVRKFDDDVEAILNEVEEMRGQILGLSEKLAASILTYAASTKDKVKSIEKRLAANFSKLEIERAAKAAKKGKYEIFYKAKEPAPADLVKDYQELKSYLVFLEGDDYVAAKAVLDQFDRTYSFFSFPEFKLLNYDFLKYFNFKWNFRNLFIADFNLSPETLENQLWQLARNAEENMGIQITVNPPNDPEDHFADIRLEIVDSEKLDAFLALQQEEEAAPYQAREEFLETLEDLYRMAYGFYLVAQQQEKRRTRKDQKTLLFKTLRSIEGVTFEERLGKKLVDLDSLSSAVPRAPLLGSSQEYSVMELGRLFNKTSLEDEKEFLESGIRELERDIAENTQDPEKRNKDERSLQNLQYKLEDIEAALNAYEEIQLNLEAIPFPALPSLPKGNSYYPVENQATPRLEASEGIRINIGEKVSIEIKFDSQTRQFSLTRDGGKTHELTNKSSFVIGRLQNGKIPEGVYYAVPENLNDVRTKQAKIVLNPNEGTIRVINLASNEISVFGYSYVPRSETPLAAKSEVRTKEQAHSIFKNKGWKREEADAEMQRALNESNGRIVTGLSTPDKVILEVAQAAVDRTSKAYKIFESKGWQYEDIVAEMQRALNESNGRIVTGLNTSEEVLLAAANKASVRSEVRVTVAEAKAELNRLIMEELPDEVVLYKGFGLKGGIKLPDLKKSFTDIKGRAARGELVPSEDAAQAANAIFKLSWDLSFDAMRASKSESAGVEIVAKKLMSLYYQLMGEIFSANLKKLTAGFDIKALKFDLVTPKYEIPQLDLSKILTIDEGRQARAEVRSSIRYLQGDIRDYGLAQGIDTVIFQLDGQGNVGLATNFITEAIGQDQGEGVQQGAQLALSERQWEMIRNKKAMPVTSVDLMKLPEKTRWNYAVSLITHPNAKTPPTEESIKTGIKNALRLASQSGAKSVVMPLFGTRAQRLDESAVANWEREAAEEFLKESNSEMKVALVIYENLVYQNLIRSIPGSPKSEVRVTVVEAKAEVNRLIMEELPNEVVLYKGLELKGRIKLPDLKKSFTDIKGRAARGELVASEDAAQAANAIFKLSMDLSLDAMTALKSESAGVEAVAKKLMGLYYQLMGEIFSANLKKLTAGFDIKTLKFDLVTPKYEIPQLDLSKILTIDEGRQARAEVRKSEEPTAVSPVYGQLANLLMSGQSTQDASPIVEFAGSIRSEVRSVGIKKFMDNLVKTATKETIAAKTAAPESSDPEQVNSFIGFAAKVILDRISKKLKIGIRVSKGDSKGKLQDLVNNLLKVKGILDAVIVSGDIQTLDIQALKKAGVPVTTIKKLELLKSSNLIDQKVLPIILADHYENIKNNLLRTVGVDKKNIEDPVLEAGESFLQVGISLLAADLLKGNHDAESAQLLRKEIADLLFKGADNIVTVDKEGNLSIDRSLLKTFVAEFAARAEVRKAA